VFRYFSIFTGVGGFELGFERANHSQSKIQEPKTEQDSSNIGRNELEGTAFNCIGFSEIDKYCNQVLRYRFPEIRNYGDATKIDPRELPDFDLLCGGFPCQAFSIAGKRRGFKDTRGTLFFEIARILEFKRPKIVFLENVKGLLNHEKGKTFRIILQTLDELGYDIQWMVLNSKFFGVPQNRERVFIIGNLRGKSRPEILPFREDAGKIQGASGEEIVRPTLTSHGETSCSIPTPMVAESKPKQIVGTLSATDYKQPKQIFDSLHGFGHGWQGYHTYKMFKQGILRRLTPIECERLQGFPDDWTKYGINEKGEIVEMSDTQRYKMMGNAVTINVIEAIAKKLIYIKPKNI